MIESLKLLGAVPFILVIILCGLIVISSNVIVNKQPIGIGGRIIALLIGAICFAIINAIFN